MGSWPTVTPDRVPPFGPGPKFLIPEPLSLALGEDRQRAASMTVREMTQQICQRRLEFNDVTRKNLADLESIEKAKCNAQSLFVDQLSSGKMSVKQDAMKGLVYLQARILSEGACMSQEVVQGLHAEVSRFRNPDKGPGQLRTCNAYSKRGNDIHWFPSPHVVPSSLAARLKKHNYYVSKKSSFADPYTPEYVDFVCRCAASLLYDIVDLHPFRDGNDLVAQLLMSNILQLVIPFPVTVSVGSLYESRGVYRDAKCQEKDSELAALAARILEGLWHSWEGFAKELDLDE